MPTSPRLRALAALVLLCLLGAPAEAAPRRPCELLKDAKGDAGLNGGEGGVGPILPGTYEGSRDIISADIATDRTRLTAVIRLASLDPAASPIPIGRSWSFHFATPEAAFYVTANQRATESGFRLFHYLTEYSGDTSQSYVVEGVGPVSGVLDGTTAEVRMTVPLSMLAPYDKLTDGNIISKLLVIAWSDVEGSQTEYDEAGGGGPASYRVGTKNCVRVGS